MKKLVLPNQKLKAKSTPLSDIEFWHDNVLSVHADMELRKTLKWKKVNEELKKVGHGGISSIKSSDDLSIFPENTILIKESPSIASFF